ncbi:MAG: hypothetical protein OSB26_02120 [Woeseiaceae bacterium]|nr:hypothetical protein [Woeseiaceae bacterium]
MSESNPIRVFVTHTFQQREDYMRVFEFLESMERFFYTNCSKPENMPEMGYLDSIKEELIAQIKESEAMLVLASQYLEQNDLTRFQMDVADANDIAMIAIRPFGGLSESPPDLVSRVNEHIEWNEWEIADSLKRQGRLEQTSRWETIEFTLD